MPDVNNNLTPLPYSLQAEQAVLGSVLVDSDCMEKVATIVKPNISIARSQGLFRLCCNVHGSRHM
jgi:replicative DNA helicase